jgi:hypothetical protein
MERFSAFFDVTDSWALESPTDVNPKWNYCHHIHTSFAICVWYTSTCNSICLPVVVFLVFRYVLIFPRTSRFVTATHCKGSRKQEAYTVIDTSHCVSLRLTTAPASGPNLMTAGRGVVAVVPSRTCRCTLPKARSGPHTTMSGSVQWQTVLTTERWK